MQQLLSGQEFAPPPPKKKKKKTNKQRNERQRNYPLPLSDSMVHPFFHLGTVWCTFCVRGVQNLGSGAKQTEKTQTNKPKRGNKLFRILRSFFQVTMLTFL